MLVAKAILHSILLCSISRKMQNTNAHLYNLPALIYRLYSINGNIASMYLV